MLHKVVRQGGKASFAEAGQDLQALCGLQVSPTHVQRLTERVGREWAGLRDRDVAAGARRHDWQLPGEVAGVTFAPDGRHLAAANANGTVYLLRLARP